MTDFINVIKQRNKMCDKYLAKAEHICINCPLYSSNNSLHKTCDNLIFENPEKALEIINKWTEENTDHSKFRYPTWREWWLVTFPDAPCCLTECMFRNPFNYKETDCDNMICDECMNMYIPDDIAKKLNIEPIEYSDDEEV
jgi:hypothetical protein